MKLICPVVMLALVELSALADPQPKLAKHGPVGCSGVESVAVDHVVIDTDGEALVARGTCDLVIKNSVIHARRGAVQLGTGTITLIDTTVEASDSALVATGAGDIAVTGGSITSAHDAVRLTSSGTIRLTSTTVTGDPNAIVNTGSGSVLLRNTRVSGRKSNRGVGEILEN